MLIKIFFFFLLALSLDFYSCANKKEPDNDEHNDASLGNKISHPDFRNVKWGMSFEDVKKLEESKLDTENNNTGKKFLIYSANIADENCSLIYYFDRDDKLAYANYSFRIDAANLGKAVADYSRISGLITSEYKMQPTNQTKWFDSLFKNDSSQYFLALYKGFVKFEESWIDSKRDSLHIFHSLNKDEYGSYGHTLMYFTREGTKTLMKEKKDSGL